MVCAYMSAKPSASRSWTSASWNAFISLVTGPSRSRSARTVLIRSRMTRASSASRTASAFEVVMTSRWRSVKAERQLSRQASTSLSSSGQASLLGERVRDVVEVERRVEVVPAQHLEGRQVGLLRVLREVGEADLTLVALAEVGNEEQVVRLPRRRALRCWLRRASSARPGSGCGAARRPAAASART